MVYVFDKRMKPLLSCSLKRARQLLDRGRARVHKRFPFTIRRVNRFEEDSVPEFDLVFVHYTICIFPESV